MTNKRTFGPDLVAKLNAELAESRKQEQDRETRISQCEVEWTDCFLSIAANQIGQDVTMAKLQILKDGGYHDFNALVDEAGNDSGATWCQTRFGGAWKLDGKFLGKKAYHALGLHEGSIAKPAWCKIGATSRTCWFVHFFPTPDKFNYWTGQIG